MATFRIKPAAFWAHFLAHMRQLENTTGEGSTQAIRKVAEGEAVLQAYPIPYVLLQLLGLKVVDRADVDKQWVGKIKIRVVSNITSADGATTEILSKAAQVQNRLESYVKPDGVTGMENAEWAFATLNDANAGALVTADCVVDVAIMVARGSN